MNIIILGDKFQKRMKSKGCVGLLENNKKTLLHNQYQNIKAVFPEAKVVYVYGFEAKRFQNYIENHNTDYSDLVIINNSNYDSYNSAYSLSLASHLLDTDCIIVFGDTILNKNILARFSVKNGSQIFLSYNKTYKLGCTIVDSRLVNIDYDLNNYLYNMYYLQKTDVGSLQKIVNNKNNHNCFIFELMNKLLEDNINIKPFFIDSKKRVVA